MTTNKTRHGSMTPFPLGRRRSEKYATDAIRSRRSSRSRGSSRGGAGGGRSTSREDTKPRTKRGAEVSSCCTWREGNRDSGKVPSNPRGWPDRTQQADLDVRPQRVIVVNGEQEHWFCTNFVRTSKVCCFCCGLSGCLVMKNGPQSDSRDMCCTLSALCSVC